MEPDYGELALVSRADQFTLAHPYHFVVSVARLVRPTRARTVTTLPAIRDREPTGTIRTREPTGTIRTPAAAARGGAGSAAGGAAPSVGGGPASLGGGGAASVGGGAAPSMGGG